MENIIKGRRFCYTAVSGDHQDPKKHGGYMPSMVIDGDIGHYPMQGREDDGWNQPEFAMPWIWGNTIEEVGEACNRFNSERLGLSEDQAWDIEISARGVGSTVSNNITTAELGHHQLWPPCVRSGHCCMQAPCGYGLAGEDGSCIYLLPDNDLGQRKCGKYDEIRETEKHLGFKQMMGMGCSSPIANTRRAAVISNLRKMDAR